MIVFLDVSRIFKRLFPQPNGIGMVSERHLNGFSEAFKWFSEDIGSELSGGKSLEKLQIIKSQRHQKSPQSSLYDKAQRQKFMSTFFDATCRHQDTVSDTYGTFSTKVMYSSMKGREVPTVDISNGTKVTKVEKSKSIILDCGEKKGLKVIWTKDGAQLNSERSSSKLRIDDAKEKDAGIYMCQQTDKDGNLKATLSISLWVEVPILMPLTMRIINWNYTEEFKNKSSEKYKTFESEFKAEMDKVFRFVPGYIGVEILNITEGSLQVRFRVRSIVTIKDSSKTTTGARVNATMALIDKARTGWLGKLQVDSRPEFLKISAPPPSPENVTVLDVSTDGAELSWDQPRNYLYFAINGYFVEYWEFGSKNKRTSDSNRGVATKLAGLEPKTAYVARIVAENAHGRGVESNNIDIKTEGDFPSWIIAVIVIACLLLIVILIVICYRRRKKRKAESRDDLIRMRRLELEKDYHPRSFINPTMFNISEECKTFPREDLVLLEELGSGEFGIVYKGQLVDDGESMTCAVKTLKEGASDEDNRGLYQELYIMNNIGYHENLVNLIGACTHNTKKGEQLYVLVEYASNGSLIDYLRKQRLGNPEEVYDLELNYVNRLNIALDVAKGMAFLAMKRCVHRDLAARNILLADNFVAKVADFGLSRDIYETGQYEKKTVGKLPVRWMALESLEMRKFTLESDIWSFGVLLWEIETKGLMPHGVLAFKELLQQTKDGYRLHHPSGTPDKLYRLMQICWSADPKKRPSFSQLYELLDVLKIEVQGKELAYGKPREAEELTNT